MKLADIRKEKNIRAVDLAAKIGVSQGYYSNLERGKRPFNNALLKKTAKVLSVPINTLSNATKANLADSVKLKSWMSGIRINGLPFIKAFQYYVEANALTAHMGNNTVLKKRIKEFIEANIGYSVLAELSENNALLEEVRERINMDRQSG
jgi:transcriptional regulator with XRE-family HTH domain